MTTLELLTLVVLASVVIWLVLGLVLLRQRIRWYRIRRDIARDAEQRARLQQIMRATDGRR